MGGCVTGWVGVCSLLRAVGVLLLLANTINNCGVMWNVVKGAVNSELIRFIVIIFISQTPFCLSF